MREPIDLTQPPDPQGIHQRLLEAINSAGKTFDDIARDTILDREILNEQQQNLAWDSFTIRVIADYLGSDAFAIQTGFTFDELGRIITESASPDESTGQMAHT